MNLLPAREHHVSFEAPENRQATTLQRDSSGRTPVSDASSSGSSGFLTMKFMREIHSTGIARLSHILLNPLTSTPLIPLNNVWTNNLQSSRNKQIRDMGAGIRAWFAGRRLHGHLRRCIWGTQRSEVGHHVGCLEAIRRSLHQS
ncbi:hypothetical protein M3J09_004457 [Ascochyta lentis]